MEQKVIRESICMSPREIFEIYLRDSFGLSSFMANEATEFAIDLFHLDKTGKLPIDWELWYRNQA